MSTAAERATWKADAEVDNAPYGVLALLADVERLERELHICGLARDLANEESIQLEAENRRLREADL